MQDVGISSIMVSVDAPAIHKKHKQQKKKLCLLRIAMTLDLGEQMSNLYMTTEEFAAMVVDTLHDQNYFKKGGKHHPGDIVIAFTSAAESIAAALEWAISKEHEVKRNKQAVMRTSTLAKNNFYNPTTSYGSVTYSSNTVLPQDEEIAPLTEGADFDYAEWKYGKKFK
jgi:hypothetical protein